MAAVTLGQHGELLLGGPDSHGTRLQRRRCKVDADSEHDPAAPNSGTAASKVSPWAIVLGLGCPRLESEEPFNYLQHRPYIITY